MDIETGKSKRNKRELLLGIMASMVVLGWIGAALAAPPRSVEILTGILLLLGGLLLGYDTEGAILRRIIAGGPTGETGEPVFRLPRALVWPLAFFLYCLGLLFLVGGFVVRPEGLMPF